MKSGLLPRFPVATPTHYREQQLDPWIVVEVPGNTDRRVVVTQRDV